MFITFKQQLAVDFVGDDGSPVPDNDVSQLNQVLPSPETPDGVVGIAEDDRPGATRTGVHAGLRLKLAFKVGEVHLVASVNELKLVGGDMAAVGFNRGEKRVID